MRYHRLLILLGALLALLLPACAPDPLESTIERLDRLQALLERHKDDPDALLGAMEDFIAQHQDQWQRDRAAIDKLSDDARTRLEARYERRLQQVMGRLLDNSLEVQARLAHDPVRLARFLALMDAIR